MHSCRNFYFSLSCMCSSGDKSHQYEHLLRDISHQYEAFQYTVFSIVLFYIFMLVQFLTQWLWPEAPVMLIPYCWLPWQLSPKKRLFSLGKFQPGEIKLALWENSFHQLSDVRNNDMSLGMQFEAFQLLASEGCLGCWESVAFPLAVTSEFKVTWRRNWRTENKAN